MASIAAQIAAGRRSSRAASMLEAENRSRIADIFDRWDAGEITNRQVRHRLENVVRGAYRASGMVAREHTKRTAELEGWDPADQTFQTPYLDNLLRDVRRNLRDYTAERRRRSATDQDLALARRRALSRMQHSAGVATTRGYTDGLIEAHRELEDFGFRLVKMWLANFTNNSPCDHCRALHGTTSELRTPFHVPSTVRRLKVYRDLQGPPAHPRCRCVLVILTIQLENALEPISPDVRPEDDDDPDESSMTAAAVRGLSKLLFGAFVAGLQAIIKLGAKLLGVPKP